RHAANRWPGHRHRPPGHAPHRADVDQGSHSVSAAQDTPVADTGVEPLNVAFVWHMHQPYYRNQMTGEYMLPWVLLHGTKDYLHMVEVLEDFPSIHQTFNLVPSLVQHLANYAAGKAVDRCSQVTRIRADELNPEDKEYVL